MATGMIAGLNAARLARGLDPVEPPRESATGSLIHYLSHASPENYQPANTTFALFPPLAVDERKRLKKKAERHRVLVERGMAAFRSWQATIDDEPEAEANGAAPFFKPDEE
jgi:methylenetetrahydrofolate--tRNA-(uracil-5-)-methyltransferase